MKFFAISAAVVLSASTLLAQSDSSTGDTLLIGPLTGCDTDTAAAAPPLRLHDPVKLATASFIIPGLGQVCTQHYVKAGFLLALDAIFGSMAYFWNQSAIVQEENAASLMVQAQGDVAHGYLPSDSSNDVELAYLTHYTAMNNRFSAYNFLTWTIGAHIYNVFDAIDASNHFKDQRERNAGTAFLLSAIPGLGLGQIYNGAWSKAGFVIMGQWSLAMMAFNGQRLMIQAQNNFQRLNTPLADSTANSIRVNTATLYSQEWASNRYTAFSTRNMFLWYSIFFYGYSICDAVVDAYLHDYADRMKIKPDLVVGPKSIEFSLSTKF